MTLAAKIKLGIALLAGGGMLAVEIISPQSLISIPLFIIVIVFSGSAIYD